MSQLLDIFLQPGRVFAAERERPTFLVPLLLMAALTGVMTLAYFLRVDPSWYAEHMLDNSGRELTAAQAEQMRSAMPGTRTMGVIGAVTGSLAVAVMTAIIALYVLVAAKVTGRPLGFRHGMSLAAWSSMPMLLGLIIATVGALTMSPQTGIESLMLTNVDPLLVDLPADHKWNRLAQGFNLLTFWSLFLFALGWRTWTRASWLQSVVVALVPTLVMVGILVLFS